MNGLHLLAGAGSVANGATNTAVGRLIDNYFTNANDGYQSVFDNFVVAAYARVPDGSGARINSPLLRVPTQPRLALIDTAADPPNLPPVNMWGDNGPLLKALDPLNVEVSRAGAGAATCQYGLWVGKGFPAKFMGKARTIRATTSMAGSTTAWTPATLTLEQGLPVGRYAIVGCMGYGANLLFGRFIFPDAQHRPGFLAQQSVSEYSWDWFRNGNMGKWGEFDQQALPTMEFLHYGAGTNPTVEIDIVQLR